RHEHDEGDRGDGVQGIGQPVDLLLLGRDRDDAGRHHEGEDAGEEVGDQVVRFGPARLASTVRIGSGRVEGDGVGVRVGVGHGRRYLRKAAAAAARTTETMAVAQANPVWRVWKASTATVMRKTWKATRMIR